MSEQRCPIPNSNPSIHDLVIADMKEVEKDLIDEIKKRKDKGLQTYGTILQANNGRDAFQDAIDELADAVVYLRQLIEEGHRDTQIEYCYLSTLHQLKLLLEVKNVRSDLQPC